MSDTYIEPQEQMKIIEALQFVAQKSKQYINKKIEQIELIPGPEGPEGPMGPMGPQGERGDPGDTPELAEWVLAPEKPEYTAEEVGALPADTKIPSIEGLATEEYVTNSIKTVTDALKTVLPTVTTADAGKFLRVSAEGLWTAEFLMDVSEVGA